MALATRRAARGIFVTSFTTASAFIVTSLSEVIPIRAFGTFSAVLVIIDFVLTLTLFPAQLLLHSRFTQTKCYRRLSARCCPCCTKSKK